MTFLGHRDEETVMILFLLLSRSPESWKLGWREPSDFKNPLPPWPDAEEEMAEMEAAAGGEGAAACGHRHGRGNRH